ncbi:MAG: succinate dehydrogenase cytochrome b subunit [Acidobacteriaceae bacterium]
MKESILPVSPVPPRIQAPERPRREVAINQIAALWDSMIGKKVVMAITGAVLVLFVIMHMIGNLKILSGPDNINAYAVFLREVGRPELGYGQLLWIVRIILLICVILHVTAVIQLTRMNQVARPVAYNVKKSLRTTIAAQTMRCGGVVLLAFIIFHLLHLTAGAVGFRPGQFKHLAVYQNVIAGLSSWPVAIFYIVAMAALSMHLHHGIWSAFQTLGFNTSRNTRILQTLCRLIALAVFLGFVSVPVSVLAGWLR